MPRTTLDLDAPILKDLKLLSRRTGKSLGRLASELIARGLAEEEAQERPRAFRWTARPLGARIDLEDKEALWALLDEPYRRKGGAQPAAEVAEGEEPGEEEPR